MGLEISIHNETDHVVMNLNGRIDLSSNPYFIKILNEVLLFSKPLIVLDFSHVTFISSVGIGAIIEGKTYNENNGSRFILTGLSERLFQVFELIGAINPKDFVPSLPDAIQLLHVP
ncbi:MAG: STAS domain-containing protein [Spirochaetia bacterium]|nr:STAS domain-containing protein [Spirochaetia bacterium]